VDVPQFAVNAAMSQSQSEAVLAAGTITFESGLDVLDPSAVAILNGLGAVMARCAEEGTIKALIGGHTDNQGDALDNRGLSQRRAVAVRKTLIARAGCLRRRSRRWAMAIRNS
jgi:outer membrane protein OmpA-like peptidoglycan-associated protein